MKLILLASLILVQGNQLKNDNLEELWDVASSIEHHLLTVDKRILTLGVCGSGKSSFGKALLGPREPNICRDQTSWIGMFIFLYEITKTCTCVNETK